MNTVILIGSLVIIVPAVALAAATLLARVLKRGGYTKQQIDAATAEYHARKKAGEVELVLTQPDPEDAFP